MINSKDKLINAVFSGTPKKKLGTSIGNVAGNIGNIFTNAYEDIANFLKNLFGG